MENGLRNQQQNSNKFLTFLQTLISSDSLEHAEG